MPGLKVELPVCPGCGHVGKVPYATGFKSFCVGSGPTSHKKKRMVPVVFTAPALEVGESR